jgi:hypothetical protein
VEVLVNPPEFDPAEGFDITVIGGTPPFTFTALTAPPNPPGVDVTSSGPTAHATVPVGTPADTVVGVRVTDSSVPPVVRIARAKVRGGPGAPPSARSQGVRGKKPGGPT